MKKIFLSFLCIGLVMMGGGAQATPQDISHETPVVAVDAEANRSRMPKSFRTTKDAFVVKKAKKWVKDKKKFPSRKGMDLVSVSASGQFSDVSFRNLVKILEEKGKKLYVGDLRQESHGFAGGHAVSLYGRHNALNRGLSEKEAARAETAFLEDLSRKAPAHIYKVIEKKRGEIFKVVPLRIHPAPVVSEKDLVESYGAEYRRFRTLDHSYPDVETMTAFVDFVKTLPQEAHVHLHCRGGRGRATQYMAYMLILKNAPSHSLEDILDYLYLIGGKGLHHISQSPHKGWKRPFAENRLKHIEYVYEYAKDPEGYKTCSWKAWLEKKKYTAEPLYALKAEEYKKRTEDRIERTESIEYTG